MDHDEHVMHRNAAIDFLTQKREGATLAREYALTQPEILRLCSLAETFKAIRGEALGILLFALKRREQLFVTFEDDIMLPDHDTREYSFIADLRSEFPEFYPDLDNHDITNLLIKEGVIDEDDPDSSTDPEMCCSYLYFKTEQSARAFILRFNAYLVRRSTEHENQKSARQKK